MKSQIWHLIHKGSEQDQIHGISLLENFGGPMNMFKVHSFKVVGTEVQWATICLSCGKIGLNVDHIVPCWLMILIV